MESVFGRYRNLIILVAALFCQVVALGVQVRRNTETEPTRLIRVWVVSAVTPLEKSLYWVQHSSSELWRNYFYLRGVRQENRDLKAQIEQLRIEQVRLSEDAAQARRLQNLLNFKEQFVGKTVAAQVIGSSGSEQSRSIYIDKGAREGIKTDMPVITADGVVGKVLRVFGSRPMEASTSQVLLINDQTSGVGAILEKSRAQGFVRGTASGQVLLENIMSDETVQAGDVVLTSGGDRIFPKGLHVGAVTRVSQGPEIFWKIGIRPSVDLSKLEEVLVITEEQSQQPDVAEDTHARAADILAARLPSIPDQQADSNAPPPPTSNLKISPAAGSTTTGGTIPAASAKASLTPAPASDGSATTNPKARPLNTLPAAAQKAAVKKNATGAAAAPDNEPAKPDASAQLNKVKPQETEEPEPPNNNPQ